MRNKKLNIIIFGFIFPWCVYSQVVDTLYYYPFQSGGYNVFYIKKIDTIRTKKSTEIKEVKLLSSNQEILNVLRSRRDTIEGFINHENGKKHKAYLRGLGLNKEFYPHSGALRIERKAVTAGTSWVIDAYYPSGKKMFHLKEFAPTTRDIKTIKIINNFWTKENIHQVINGDGSINAEFDANDYLPIFENFDSLKIKGKFKVEGQVIKGRKEGIWKITDYDNQLEYTEKFISDKFMGGKVINLKTTVLRPYNDLNFIPVSQVFSLNQIFLKELNRRLPHTNWAKNGRKENGTVFIELKINEKGDISPIGYKSTSKNLLQDVDIMFTNMIKFKSISFKTNPVLHRGIPRAMTFKVTLPFTSNISIK